MMDICTALLTILFLTVTLGGAAVAILLFWLRRLIPQLRELYREYRDWRLEVATMDQDFLDAFQWYRASTKELRRQAWNEVASRENGPRDPVEPS